MPSKSLVHLNGNILCSVDTETTGLDPHYHDIIEISCCPLDGQLKPHPDIMPFTCLIQPRFPDRISPKAMRVNKLKLSDLILDGMENAAAGDAFIEWFDALNLGRGKNIMPLAHNWPFDKAFILEWLGPENFSHCFHYHARDSCAAALFLNDLADSRLEKIPYPKVNLQYLAGQLKVPTERTHRAQEDALTTAEVYRRLLQSV